MIEIKQSGSFRNTEAFLERAKNVVKMGVLDKYGRKGVEALELATPKDTGLTSKSWEYKITNNKDYSTISFFNTNIQKGIPIAIILQHGHATRNGGYVQGRDYINPAIQPIFDKLAEEVWKEVIE